MRILDIITESNNFNNTILTETKTYQLWESAGRAIKEAALSPDQIQQLFQQIEQGATDSGANRTMLGKGKDAAAAVNSAWNELKDKVQSSKPIKAVDQKFDDAVAKIEKGLGGPDNKVNQVIQKYRAFAKDRPISQGLIYAALIAAAGISGAGLGGAAVLGLLKMTDKLLQGEKFSSAAYAGGKTGALAYGAGQIGQAVKGGDAPVSAQPKDGEVFGLTAEPERATTEPAKAASSEPAKAAATEPTKAGDAKAIPSIEEPISGPGGEFEPIWNGETNSYDIYDLANPDTPVATDLSQSDAMKTAQDLSTGSGPNAVSPTANEPEPTAKASKIEPEPEPEPEPTAKASKIEPEPEPTAKASKIEPEPEPTAKASKIEPEPEPEPTAKASKIEPEPTANEPKQDIFTVGDKTMNRALRATVEKMSPEDQEQTIAAWRVLAGGSGDTQDKLGAGQLIQRLTKKYENIARPGNAIIETKTLTLKEIKRIFEWCDNTPSTVIMEGPLDKIKGKLNTVGKNLTTKITVDKLNSAWKKAKSPTDSVEIANVLRKAGVSDQVLMPVFKAMNIELAPPTTNTAANTIPKQSTATTSSAASDKILDFKSLSSEVSKLRARDAQSLLKYLDSIDPVKAKPAAAKTPNVKTTVAAPRTVTKSPKQKSSEPNVVPAV